MFDLLEFDHFPVAISKCDFSLCATLDRMTLTVRLPKNLQCIDFVLIFLVLESSEPHTCESAYASGKKYEQLDMTHIRKIRAKQ
jgi:hypothetical protein